MSERVCPECGSQVLPLETQQDPQRRDGPRITYACTSEGCGGRLEDVSDDDAATANEPTGGDNIGA